MTDQNTRLTTRNRLLRNVRCRIHDFAVPTEAKIAAPYPAWSKPWWDQFGMLVATERRITAEILRIA